MYVLNKHTCASIYIAVLIPKPLSGYGVGSVY